MGAEKLKAHQETSGHSVGGAGGRGSQSYKAVIN